MKNLRSIREQNKLTQRDCATALSMPKTTFCYYEQGKVSPSVETLLRIADYFNCSVDYLLGHETKGILHLDSLSNLQQELVNKIKIMDEHNLTLLKGALIAIEENKSKK